MLSRKIISVTQIQDLDSVEKGFSLSTTEAVYAVVYIVGIDYLNKILF